MAKKDSLYRAQDLAMQPDRAAEPARPRLAASVIVVRPAPREAFQVLLVRRIEGTGFARSAFVFPGGTVDPADREVPLARPAPEEARDLLAASGPGTPDDPLEARSVWAAALRELTEETGLEVAPGHVIYFSRWITPEALPRRFDTHFFLATAPRGARLTLNPSEHTEARWLSPARALAGHGAGETPMVFPTLRQLEGLARFDSHHALLEFARRRRVRAITLPRLVEEDGAQVMLVPPDPDGLW